MTKYIRRLKGELTNMAVTIGLAVFCAFIMAATSIAKNETGTRGSSVDRELVPIGCGYSDDSVNEKLFKAHHGEKPVGNNCPHQFSPPGYLCTDHSKRKKIVT